MGVSTGEASGGPRSDINVTPLVDVVLVLLIIFLVAMPILLHSLTIEVPRSDPGAVASTTPVILRGNGDGTIEIDDGARRQSVARVDLARTIRPMIEAMKSEPVVFVEFDDEMAYADIVSIMDTVRGTGRDTSGNEPSPVRIALKTTRGPEAGEAGPLPAVP